MRWSGFLRSALVIAGPVATGALTLVALNGQTTSPPSVQPAGTASLSGRVVTTNTGGLVRAAAVSLDEVSGRQWVATTDSDGRFTFPQLPAGRYTIKVSKGGFVPTVYGQPVADSTAEPVPMVIDSGAKINRGDLALPPASAISGRVIDGHGDAVPEVSVSALRRDYIAPGHRRMGTVRSVRTDDLGEFRIYGLAPGTYYVGVGLSPQAPRGLTNPLSGEPRLVPDRSGIAPTFYPGTAVAVDASPIVLSPGQDVSNLILTPLSVPLATLSGTIVDSQGRPASRMTVLINEARLDGVFVSGLNATETDAAGNFALANVAPGDYRIDVMSRARVEAVGLGAVTFRGEVPSESASVPITVTGQSVNTLLIRLALGFDVRGRLVAEAGAIPHSGGAAITVNASPVFRSEGISSVWHQSTARVEADGRFALTDVRGPRLIRIHGLPSEWALKGVFMAGTDVTDGGIDVTSDIGTLEVIVTATPTLVRGKATNADGSPLRESSVVVFSAHSHRWTLLMSRYVASSPVDTVGGFAIRGLPPGDYLAAITGWLTWSNWADPELLERLRSSATPLTLADGETKTLTLRRRK